VQWHEARGGKGLGTRLVREGARATREAVALLAWERSRQPRGHRQWRNFRSPIPEREWQRRPSTRPAARTPRRAAESWRKLKVGNTVHW